MLRQGYDIMWKVSSTTTPPLCPAGPPFVGLSPVDGVGDFFVVVCHAAQLPHFPVVDCRWLSHWLPEAQQSGNEGPLVVRLFIDPPFCCDSAQAIRRWDQPSWT